MTIREFATQYCVKTRRDSCEEEIIPGKPRKAVRAEDRSHIYDHGDGEHFGLCLLFATPGKWTFAKQRLLAAGFMLRQNGETEGTLLFDPSKPDQARAALKEAGVKVRRVLSEARRTALAERLKRVRPCVETRILAKITTAVPQMALDTENGQGEVFPR